MLLLCLFVCLLVPLFFSPSCPVRQREVRAARLSVALYFSRFC
jgi:hypothetical protein